MYRTSFQIYGCAFPKSTPLQNWGLKCALGHLTSLTPHTGHTHGLSCQEIVLQCLLWGVWIWRSQTPWGIGSCNTFSIPPQNESSAACCEYVLAGDDTCILPLFYIYIYIIGFSADDLKKLQHMLIASKYRVILAEIVYVYLFLWTHVEKKYIYNYIYVCVSAVVHMFCLHINTHTHTYHIYLRSNITCKHDT